MSLINNMWHVKMSAALQTCDVWFHIARKEHDQSLLCAVQS